jgi:hypothetical protein
MYANQRLNHSSHKQAKALRSSKALDNLCENDKSDIFVDALLTLPYKGCLRYTLSELMLHEAFYNGQPLPDERIEIRQHTMKFDGSLILSAHVPGQPDVA